MKATDPIITLDGVVSSLQHTTHVTGGGDNASTTTHISLFALGEKRVELRLLTPASIIDGDPVRVTGAFANGVFTAIACRNLKTGWISPEVKSGCTYPLLIVLVISSMVIGVAISFGSGFIATSAKRGVGFYSFVFIPIAFILPALAIWHVSRIHSHISRAKAAREMVM